MKEIKRIEKICLIWTLILLMLVAGLLFIHQNNTNTDVTAEKTKVGVLMNGIITDHSWTQSHYEGLEKSAVELNLAIDYRECVPEDSSCIAIMEELIDSGCEIIIANSFGYGEYMMEEAGKHPDIYFFHATGSEKADNLASFFGRIYQMRYLSGIVAGLQTETNQIGYVAAYDMSEVNRGINAFALGVRSVNPDATVHVSFIGSWMDDALTQTATEQLLAACPEIDLLAMHTDSLKVLEIAEEKGIWSIGYNIDNHELAPNTFLTAAVWNWERFYTPNILACLQGKFTGKHYWEGIETGIVGLAPIKKGLDSDIHEAVTNAKYHIIHGDMDVFYGEIRDNEGKVRVEQGESMTDEAMLEAFDWFVEGVEIHE